MKSNLIKDTTKEERIALIKAWIPDDDGLQDCDMVSGISMQIILMENVKLQRSMRR